MQNKKTLLGIVALVAILVGSFVFFNSRSNTGDFLGRVQRVRQVRTSPPLSLPSLPTPSALPSGTPQAASPSAQINTPGRPLPSVQRNTSSVRGPVSSPIPRSNAPGAVRPPAGSSSSGAGSQPYSIQSKIQTYNAAVSTVNGFKSLLDLVEEAVNEQSGSQSLRLQILEQTQEADDKLSQLLSHYNNNLSSEQVPFTDPIFEEDLEISIFDLISTVIAPSWMSDIDIAGMMDDMQALNDFLMGIGVIGFDFTTDVGAVTMVGGAAIFFGTDGAFLGTGTIGTRPQRGGGSKLGLDTFSCEHKRCGGKGRKYKRDANGKWVDGFCTDCGWRSIVNNTTPDDFAADMFSSGPVNLNDWLSTLQNLNAALDNYLGHIQPPQ